MAGYLWLGLISAGLVTVSALVAASVVSYVYNSDTTEFSLAEWGEWSPCTHTCTSGNQERARKCTGSLAQCGLQLLRETQKCNEAVPCPIHGIWAQWTEWKNCSATCDGGEQTKTRLCNEPPPSLNGIDCRGASNLTRKCNQAPCPVDGQWSLWSEWGSCSTTCDPGYVMRSRNCDNPESSHGGEWCKGDSTEYRECDLSIPCPIHGKWSNWSPWDTCDADCGPGQKQRIRACTNPAPEHNGNACSGDATESTNCQLKECPVNGNWGLWENWSGCSEVCIGGDQTRRRNCDSPSPAHGGIPCPADSDSETRACNEGPCPVYGQWSGWSQWGSCPATCGDVVQSRSRTCTSPVPEHGGNFCFGPADETRDCDLNECPIDGGWSAWLPWTTCSRECEGGIQSAVRECTNPIPQYGGEDCPAATIYREQVCNTQKCPIHGGWTEWTGWSTCTKTCGTGSQTANRFCTNPEKQYGGNDCAGLDTKAQDCALNNCPIDGKWHAWEPWSICTASCEGGLQSTFRSCTNPAPEYGGEPCSGISTKDQACNEHACPIHGGWGTWGPWGGCSITCATGSQSASRVCDRPLKQHGGDDCKGQETKTQDCNQHINCPVHGGWSPWTATSCTKSCEGGTQSKSRQCNNPSVLHGGTPCSGPTSETGDCNVHPCPINGQWSAWTAWGGCSVTCGGGTKHRSRTCTNPSPQYYGLFCSGTSTSSTSCNTQTCPGGPLQRMRTVTGSASHSGMDDDVYIELWNTNGGHCSSSWLDTPGDTFEGTDDFTSFGGCDGFMLTASTTGRMTHKGSDGWYVGSITLYSTWGNVLPCTPYNWWIDDDERVYSSPVIPPKVKYCYSRNRQDYPHYITTDSNEANLEAYEIEHSVHCVIDELNDGLHCYHVTLCPNACFWCLGFMCPMLCHLTIVADRKATEIYDYMDQWNDEVGKGKGLKMGLNAEGKSYYDFRDPSRRKKEYEFSEEKPIRLNIRATKPLAGLASIPEELPQAWTTDMYFHQDKAVTEQPSKERCT